MTCVCGRTARLSNRSLKCIVCARGTVTPRVRYRPLTNYEKAWRVRKAKGSR
jgi:hypothetical protein